MTFKISVCTATNRLTVADYIEGNPSYWHLTAIDLCPKLAVAIDKYHEFYTKCLDLPKSINLKKSDKHCFTCQDTSLIGGENNACNDHVAAMYSQLTEKFNALLLETFETFATDEQKAARNAAIAKQENSNEPNQNT